MIYIAFLEELAVLDDESGAFGKFDSEIVWMPAEFKLMHYISYGNHGSKSDELPF